MRRLLAMMCSSAVIFGCEDGPEQIFTPNHGDPAQQNGFDTSPWVQDGDKPFEDAGQSDASGRARFCDEAESTALVQDLVLEPIIPDVSVGGIPLWSPNGGPTHADELVGRPEEGKFCDPWEVYADAYTYGPTYEIVVLFDEQTKLVESILTTSQYQGALTGSFTRDDASTETITVTMRNRIMIGTRELDEYTSPADQALHPSSWLNRRNITDLWRMVRQSFFNDPPQPDAFDCIDAKLCDILYETDNPASPQSSVVVLQDSGVTLYFSPEGNIDYIWIDLVRLAPFEKAAALDFDRDGGGVMDLGFASSTRPACLFGLDEALGWSDFQTRCIDDARTLLRVDYVTEGGRDASDVEFNGITLGFIRDLGTRAPLRDGQAPATGDSLYLVEWSRSLEAAVEEFVPYDLAVEYATRLEARLGASVSDVGNGVPVATHPFSTFSVAVPPWMASTPQRIGELFVTPPAADPYNFVTDLVSEIRNLYDSLSTDERDMVDVRVLDPVFLIEPLTDTLLDTFTHGGAALPEARKSFRSTDDRRWSIGFASFREGGVPYRLMVQYSLNFDALTFVSVERGNSAVDDLFEALTAEMNAVTGGSEPYYTLAMSQMPENPYALGSAPIALGGFDRQLAVHSATLTSADGASSFDLVLPGESMADGAGFFRQLRGERWEFIPADQVWLAGKEYSYTVYVEGDGGLGRISASPLVGSVELCSGLAIAYGDEVPRALDGWRATVGDARYLECEIVFNYSANGNVLDAVVSLANQVEITTEASRAVAAAIWR